MILCVDPDERARTATVDAFDEAGFETRAASSSATARRVLDETDTVDALVTEYELPDGTGLELVRDARELSPDTACVLFTAVGLDDIDTSEFGGVVAEFVSKDDPDARAEVVARVEQSVALQTQTAYPLPEDEGARVAALERYAANPAELGDSIDRLAELATALFDVDSSAIGLIDAHEQRFLACHGISFDPVDREDTVCTYAILDDDVTVFEDTQDDPRFSGNEGLAAANIRFYASASLTTPDGHHIGTFCVYDDTPRTFSERDRHHLQLLADEAMEQLELRRQLKGGERDV
ncbi:GAF domain-containing protein [Haloplanus vescus]|uniref:GAF domain-containing protein n=1 Tax=Haloplanus vescus TaxID=555874 RepID=A0A1H3X5H3_9EURY|nr:GAF domain-containing protein [Haloplanus vescus]SDZ94490.1 GAF domain-containing protein [Haloplanus vescus]